MGYLQPAVVQTAVPFASYQQFGTFVRFPNPTTLGNTIVVAITLTNSGPNSQIVSSVTLGTDGNSYIDGFGSAPYYANGNGSAGRVEFWLDQNCLGGQQIVQVNTNIITGSIVNIHAWEVTNVAAASLVAPLDQSFFTNTTSGTSWTTGTTPATKQPTEIAFAIAGFFTATGPPTLTGPGGNWVNTAQANENFTGTSYVSSIAGYNVLSSTGTQVYNGTSSITNAGAGPAGIITLIAATAPVANITNSAEGGTNGTTASNVNTGGLSGNAFDNVAVGAGATVAFDNTHAHTPGSLSYKIATVASAQARLQWSTTFGSQRLHWFRLYAFFTALPAATTQLYVCTQTGTAVANLVVLTTGQIQWRVGAGGTQILNSTHTIPTNQWFRIEGYVLGDAAVGQVEYKLFLTNSGDNTNPDEIQTSLANQNTTGIPDSYDFGINSATASMGPFWMDDLGVSNTGYLGSPLSPPTTGPVGMVAEMQLGGTWTDISNFLHQRDSVGVARGRQNEASGMQAGNQTDTLKNQDARFTLRNPAGAYYPNLLQNVPTRLSIPSTYGGLPTYLRLQNDDLSGFQTQDVAAFSAIQTVTGTTTTLNGPLNITTAATGGGNTLVVAVGFEGATAAGTVTSITLGGVALSSAVLGNGTINGCDVWYLTNTPAGATAVVISVTGQVGASAISAVVYEMAGQWTVDQIKSNINAAASTTYTSTATPTTTVANEFAVGVVAATGSSASGPGGGWVTTTPGAGSIIASYELLGSTGTVTYTGTLSASVTFAAVVATFKPVFSGNNLRITSGVLSVRIDCKISDWQQNHALIGKYGLTAKSWGLWTNGTGKLTFDHYDGAADHFAVSSVPVPYFSGRMAIRVDYNIPAQTVTFYTAPTMYGGWTQLGAVQTTPATVLSGGNNQPVTVGIGATNVPGMYGEVYEVQVSQAAVSTPSLVHVTTSFQTAATGTITIPSTTPGNTLIVCYGGDGNTTNPVLSALTLGGSADNWAQVVLNTPQENAQQWVDPGCLGGQTSLGFTTVNGTGGNFIFFTIYEFSGIYTPTPVWVTGANNASVATPWTVSTSGNGIAGQLAVGNVCVFITGTVNPAITGPGGWTNQTSGASGSAEAMLSGFQVLANTAVATYNGTAAAGSPASYGATIATYRPSSGTSFTPILDAVFTNLLPGVTSFNDGFANNWTQFGTAEVTNKLYRFHGEWAQSPKNSDETTKDVYVTSTAYGINQRLQNANTPLGSSMKRAYVRLPANLRLCDYWAMEDGTNATSMGSSVGGNPMTFSGGTNGPTLASNSSFVCSSAIPVFAGATFTAPVRTGSITWQDNVTRFLLSVPSSDDTTNTPMCRVFSNGTIARLELVYSTGGVLTLVGYNASNAQVFNQGATFGLAELANCRISMELTNVSGTNHFNLWVLTANGTTANGIAGGTFAGTIGGVTQVTLGNGLIGSAAGHLSVQGVSDGINDLINPLIAWIGETAGTRYARICSEEGLACRIMGPPETSVAMGAQPIDTLTNILQQCETTDQGQQFEPRDILALGYRTIRGLYNQMPMSTPSFTNADMFVGFGSTADTQLTVNDVTANSPNSALARQTMSAGFPNLSKMNTNSPNSGWPVTSQSGITTPAVFQVLAQTPPIAAGTYNIKWAVSISGTLGAPEVNNFKIWLVPPSGSGTQQAQSVNASTNGIYLQADILSVVIPAGGYSLQLAVGSNTPTTGAVYGGVILPQDAGIGSVQTTTSPNPSSNTELNSSAGWTMHVRSIDDDRYPLIPFHIARPETPADIFLLDIGDYLQIPDGPNWMPVGPIKQLAAGFIETYFPGASGIIEINGIPELPYEVATAASPGQRLASAGSFVSTAYTYGNTSLTVINYPNVTTLWTTAASDFPFPIVLAGMVLMVTNITGSTLNLPQTMTVYNTSLNGITKNIPVGTPVQVFSPMVVAL